jgi:hypothetical protein
LQVFQGITHAGVDIVRFGIGPAVLDPGWGEYLAADQFGAAGSAFAGTADGRNYYTGTF